MEMIAEDFRVHLVQRGLSRLDLLDEIDAVGPLLHHALDPAYVALDRLEPPDSFLFVHLWPSTPPPWGLGLKSIRQVKSAVKGRISPGRRVHCLRGLAPAPRFMVSALSPEQACLNEVRHA